MRWLRVLLPALAALLGGRSYAGPGESPVEPVIQAVEAAVKAHGINDAAALARIANAEDPDPWIVTDVLLSYRHRDVAVALSAASKQPSDEALRRYVAGAKPEGDPENEARAALDQASQMFPDGRYRSAADLLRGVPDLGDTLLMVEIRHVLGQALESLREWGPAADAFTQAADRADRLGWDDGSIMALTQGGITARRAHDNERATLLYERRYAVYDRLGNRDRAAATRADLGTMAYDASDYARALRFYRAAIDMLGAAPNPATAALAWTHIGAVQTTTASYDEAFLSFQKAADLYAHMEKPRPDRLADLDLFRGNLYAAVGDLEGAHEAYSRSQVLSRDSLGEQGEAYALANIGLVLADAGDLEAGLHAMEQAQRLLETVNPSDPADIAQALGNTSDILRRLARYPAAAALAQSGIRLAEEVHDADSAANVRDILADIRRDEGKPAEALEIYRKVLEEGDHLREPRLRLEALAGMAQVLLALGRTADAVEKAREAARTLDELTRDLGDGETAWLRRAQAEAFEAGSQAAAKAGDVSNLCYFLEAGRCAQLLSTLGGREALEHAMLSPATEARLGEARAHARDALQRFREAADSTGDVSRQRLKDLQAGHERALAALEEAEKRALLEARASTVRDALRTRVESLADLQRGLGADEALVLYRVFPQAALALVITRGGGRIIDLGASTSLTEAVHGLSIEEGHEVPEVAVAALKKRLFDTLALGPEVKRILLSPDGPLSEVPFVLLVPPQVRFAFTPSGTTQRILAEQRALKGQGVLALGDPDYGVARPASLIAQRSGTLTRLLPLPASGDEARAVGDVVLVRGRATEAGLAEALRQRARWRAVHFACHGVIEPSHPMFSALALTPAPPDDGLLTGYEILHMSIPADLVVLSACETAKGKVIAGEGTLGLARAFMCAGAPRLLVSLWKVDDKATAALMTKFYALWKSGTSPSEALRLAQDHVRTLEPEWSHPYYWAAWQLWGLPD